MRYLRSFARFWWNFVVGDDWRAAAGLAVTLALVWLLERAGFDVWWLLPLGVAVVLTAAIRRETRSNAQ